MEMEQSGENTEMRTKKNVGQKLVTEKRKTRCSATGFSFT